MSNYNLTLFEACEYLNRSKKSVGRYIRQGKLHPQKIKSQQGTLEYRFSKPDLETFKTQTTQDTTRQETTDTPDETDKPSQDKAEKTGQDGEVINLLKETTGLLKEQLVKKDEQIKDLGNKIDEMIKRNHETNILIGQLQSKVLMLEQPKKTIISEYKDEIGQSTPDKTGQAKPAKPIKKKKKKPKKTKQAKSKEKKTADKPKKKGFWSGIFK